MKETNICIYCLGELGVQAYYRLKQSGIRVDFFGDKDREKQGYVFEGLYCKSFEDVLEENRSTHIIVAIKNPDAIIEVFKKHGFYNVWTVEEAEQKLISLGAVPKRELLRLEDIKAMKVQLEKSLEIGCLNGIENHEIRQIMLDLRIRKRGQ